MLLTLKKEIQFLKSLGEVPEPKDTEVRKLRGTLSLTNIPMVHAFKDIIIPKIEKLKPVSKTSKLFELGKLCYISIVS